MLGAGWQVAGREAVEGIVWRDPLSEDGTDDPTDDDDVADDECRAFDQDPQCLAAGLGSLGFGRCDGRRGRSRADDDVHQPAASSRIRGFIQAMMRSAARVATMYTMPMISTPAVSIGRSLFWAANNI